MKLDQATKNFTVALVDLIGAVMGTSEVVTEVKGAKADTWPKSFSAFLKSLPESDKNSSTGQLLKNCSCVCWSDTKVDLLVMPTAPGGSIEVSAEDIDDVKDLLNSELGFCGEILLRPSVNIGAPADKKVGRPKKTESVEEQKAIEITPEELKRECVNLAQKLGNRDIVLGLLKKFGATKIDEIPKDKYPVVLNAIKNYQETTTSSGVAANEF